MHFSPMDGSESWESLARLDTQFLGTKRLKVIKLLVWRFRIPDISISSIDVLRMDLEKLKPVNRPVLQALSETMRALRQRRLLKRSKHLKKECFDSQQKKPIAKNDDEVENLESIIAVLIGMLRAVDYIRKSGKQLMFRRSNETDHRSRQATTPFSFFPRLQYWSKRGCHSRTEVS